MKSKSNKYVYKCIKNQGGAEFSLSSKKYRVGHYITYEGGPTRDINKAYIFNKGEYDIHSAGYDDGRDLRQYFQLVPVKITEQ